MLNYSRSRESVQWFFELYDKYEELELNDTSFMYVSKDRETDYCDVNLQVGECSQPTMRNKVLDECTNRGYTDVHIIDDDIVLNDMDIIELYEELSQLTKSGYICNGYTTQKNNTINKPNPRLKMKLGVYGSDSISQIIFNAHETIGYSYYNMLEVGSFRYDDELNYLWNQSYISTLQKCGKIPFLNFFVDVIDSHMYIGRSCGGIPKQIDPTKNEFDQTRLKSQCIDWVIFNNIDVVIDHYVKLFNKKQGE